jgi:lipopolysaccharide/colanic/teichoic acid biosynthesis glycosyltransferase
MLAVAALVALRLGRPVLFRQQRPGLHGRPFTLVKFRTMLDSGGQAAVHQDKERLTPFGQWLRSTSLDELPELWNIIAGDMSLVGPRPLLMQYLPRYSPEQLRRHEVRPGLTGWAQIKGRNAISWDEKLALDVWYVDNWSLALDLKILLATFLSVLKREGIAGDGTVTMSEFMGASARNHSPAEPGDPGADKAAPEGPA